MAKTTAELIAEAEARIEALDERIDALNTELANLEFQAEFDADQALHDLIDAGADIHTVTEFARENDLPPDTWAQDAWDELDPLDDWSIHDIYELYYVGISE